MLQTRILDVSVPHVPLDRADSLPFLRNDAEKDSADALLIVVLRAMRVNGTGKKIPQGF